MRKTGTTPTSKVIKPIQAKLLETQYKFILLEEKELGIRRAGNGFTLDCPWCGKGCGWLYPNERHTIVFHCENEKCSYQGATLSNVFGKLDKKTQQQYNEAMSKVRQGYAQHGRLE